MTNIFCRFVLASVLCLGAVYPAQSYAQNLKNLNNFYEVPEGLVLFYGHQVNPYRESEGDPENDGFKWNSIRHLMPEVFPDAMSKTVEINRLCKEMLDLSNFYLSQSELIMRRLAENLPEVDDSLYEYEILDSVSIPLFSSDSATFIEFAGLFPEMENQVMMARDFMMKTVLVHMLRDASFDRCPEFAARQTHIPITKPYTPSDQQNYVPGQIVP
ncbi:MAG: hypothetical protein ACK4VI_07925 [Alphaproteobacteria bacterium]